MRLVQRRFRRRHRRRRHLRVEAYRPFTPGAAVRRRRSRGNLRVRSRRRRHGLRSRRSRRGRLCLSRRGRLFHDHRPRDGRRVRGDVHVRVRVGSLDGVLASLGSLDGVLASLPAPFIVFRLRLLGFGRFARHVWVFRLPPRRRAYERHETGARPRAGLEKSVREEFDSRGSSARIFAETPRDEIVKRRGPSPGFGESRGRFARDHEDDAHRMHGVSRGLDLGHLDGADAERPHVHLAVVAGFLDHLRGHPVRGADEGVALRHGAGELRGDAEIGELDATALGEEDVAALDVAVHLVDGVEVHEALEGFATEEGDLRLAQRRAAGGEDVAHAAAAAVLHDDPKVLVAHERAEVAHDVRVDALLQHGDLATDVLEALLVLASQGDHLHGDDRAARSVASLVHRAVAPLAELLEQLEEVLRTTLLHGRQTSMRSVHGAWMLNVALFFPTTPWSSSSGRRRVSSTRAPR